MDNMEEYYVSGDVGPFEQGGSSGRRQHLSRRRQRQRQQRLLWSLSFSSLSELLSTTAVRKRTHRAFHVCVARRTHWGHLSTPVLAPKVQQPRTIIKTVLPAPFVAIPRSRSTAGNLTWSQSTTHALIFTRPCSECAIAPIYRTT